LTGIVYDGIQKQPTQLIIGAAATEHIAPTQLYDLWYINSLNVETLGVQPKAMLRWSNDGGSTWSNEHWVSIGEIGKYKNRAIWRRLGWARDRIFEVVVTDPIKAVIISANLKGSLGDN